MKKTLIALLLACFSETISAQQPIGHLSVIPKVGVNIARITNYDWAGGWTLEPASAKMKAGLSGGAELEYQLTANASFSAGVLYSMQGVAYDDYIFDLNEGKYEGVSNWHTDLHYLNVPILARYYVFENLAVMAGVQPGVLLGKRLKCEYTKWHSDDNGKQVHDEDGKINDKNLKTNSFDIAIPMGISYEWQKVMIEARYNLGLLHAFKKNITSGRNSVLTFSVGYRL